MRSIDHCIHFSQAYAKFPLLDIFNFIVDINSCDMKMN